jgi:hypothetical protein
MLEKIKNKLQQLNNQICNDTLFPYYKRLQRRLMKISLILVKKNINENYSFFINLAICLLGLNFLSLRHYLSALLCLLMYNIIRKITIYMYRYKNITQNFYNNITVYIFLSVYLMGFALAKPEENALGACAYLMSLLLSSAIIITFGETNCQYACFQCKSFKKFLKITNINHYPVFYILIIMCLFPNYFLQISLFFSLLIILKSLLMFSISFYELEIKKMKND